jgi:hypothetical protein
MYEMKTFLECLLIMRAYADEYTDTVDPSACLHITIRYGEY